ncbi:MAG: hypothetical protein JWQ09_4312 [Segetibacter sp.]|nr:hypothetical protein [Segetibacter sp.]
MPPHIKTLLVLLLIIAAIVSLLVYVNNRDNKRNKH